MRISSTEPSSVILSQISIFKKADILWNVILNDIH